MNPAQSGLDADLDRDGWVTLLECAFGSDPRQASAAALTTYSATIATTRFLVLIFQRNRFATDVTVSYEGSGDLATWLPVVPNASEVILTDFETERWTVYFPAPEPRFFIRARVEVE